MDLPFWGARQKTGAAPDLEPTSQGANFEESETSFRLLGMTLVEIRLDGEARQKLQSSRGVAVLVLDRELEAFRGGVRSGDIIAEVNSTKIRSINDLKKLLRHHDPHDPLFVFLLNAGGWRFTNLSFISGRP